ncbi:MAG: type II toxin-antitoxin system death-on-curing family toxin, partial [Firmicutes bacterium]|nr:type II toxin-antitoxin system death-on-curing family toxin [Bacillota bacterium]
EMAAAYAYHISENQPFMDGNKRVALADALVFLEMNGISLNDPEEKLLKAMHMVANKKLDKSGLAEVLKDLAERTS